MPKPDDLLMRQDPVASGGVHEKLPARLINGKYFHEFTLNELESRCAVCVGFFNQLASYVSQKNSRKAIAKTGKFIGCNRKMRGQKKSAYQPAVIKLVEGKVPYRCHSRHYLNFSQH